MREYSYRPSWSSLILSVVFNGLFAALFGALAMGWHRPYLPQEMVRELPEELGWLFGAVAVWNSAFFAVNLARLMRRGGNRDVLKLTDTELVLPGSARDGRERRLLWERIERVWAVPGLLFLRCDERNHRVVASWLPSRAAFDAVVGEVRRRVRPEVAARVVGPPDLRRLFK
jgi:hypothetical protein